MVPARFLGRIHPHFREVVQLLAVQVADEARHVEVFTRRATLRGGDARASRAPAAGRRCRPCWTSPTSRWRRSCCRCSGEGTFLNLLSFLERHAPDPVTRQVAHLALQDEARHVAFGHGPPRAPRRAAEPALRDRLRAAMERRHEALASTRRAQRRRLRRPGPAGRRRVVGRRPWPRGGTGCSCCRPTWTRAVSAGWCASASQPTKRPPSPPCTPATSCDAGRQLDVGRGVRRRLLVARSGGPGRTGPERPR